jgi:AP-1 complex subunit mu
MVLSALFILDPQGKVLISRNYRGDIPMTACEKFSYILQEREESEMRPVFTEEGITYIYVKVNGLILMAMTQKNSNVANIIYFLNRLAQVFKDYFNDVTEESIRDNFVIIYELLDEVMDFGYAQTCEAKILREVITQSGNRLTAAPKPPVALTNAVSWRSEGIKHKKNEIFLDVVEKLNLLVNSNGTVLHSEILGSVQMKSFLSGMP